MSEDIVERVARAMAPHAFVDDEPDSTAPNYWRSKARKALEAMREPTYVMLREAVPEPVHLYGEGGRGEDYQAAMEIAVQVDRAAVTSKWQAMIDAALKG